MTNRTVPSGHGGWKRYATKFIGGMLLYHLFLVIGVSFVAGLARILQTGEAMLLAGAFPALVLGVVLIMDRSWYFGGLLVSIAIALVGVSLPSGIISNLLATLIGGLSLIFGHFETRRTDEPEGSAP